MINLEISEASEQEVINASDIVFSAFKSKFMVSPRLSESASQELFNTIWRSFIQDSKEVQFIARLDGRLVASFALSAATNKSLENTFKAGEKIQYFKLFKKFGVFNVLKMRLICEMFDHKANADELYLAHIGIDESYRGRGIGKHILNWIQQYAAQQEAIKTMTLYVGEDNPNAVRLYEKLGFNTIKIEKSRLTRFLFGMKTWYFMLLVLDGE